MHMFMHNRVTEKKIGLDSPNYSILVLIVLVTGAICTKNQTKGGAKMNKKLLKRSLSVLKELRDDPNNNLEISVLNKLDYVISCLEEYEINEKEIDKQSILNFLGFVLQNIPYIIEITRTINRQ